MVMTATGPDLVSCTRSLMEFRRLSLSFYALCVEARPASMTSRAMRSR
jgi:hypothetical protein